MNYVDAHVHVWTDNFDSYPLAEGYSPSDMAPKTFLPEVLLQHANASGVDRIVLIQMSYYRYDNSYMLDVMREHPGVFSGIAIVDWTAKNPAVEMKKLRDRGVRGFRIYPGETSVETWLDAPGVHEMFKYAGDEQLAMCPLVNPDALPSISRMCDRYPDTPVVIDHLSRIGAGTAVASRDIDSLCELAKRPNVMVKVSAFYALGEKQPPYLDLTPMIKRVFEAFGPNRLMWASDCPFQVDDHTYEDSIGLVRDRLDFLGDEDRECILRKTAEDFFFRHG